MGEISTPAIGVLASRVRTSVNMVNPRTPNIDMTHLAQGNSAHSHLQIANPLPHSHPQNTNMLAA